MPTAFASTLRLFNLAIVTFRTSLVFDIFGEALADPRWHEKGCVTVDMLANFGKQKRHSKHKSGKTHSQ